LSVVSRLSRCVGWVGMLVGWVGCIVLYVGVDIGWIGLVWMLVGCAFRLGRFRPVMVVDLIGLYVEVGISLIGWLGM
jgi:hypothetical protein